jgi:hypothetical protein
MDDFLLNVTVDLTPEQVLFIIRDAVFRKYPEFTVEKIDFKTEAEYDMRGEHYGTKVKGVTLKMKKK